MHKGQVIQKAVKESGVSITQLAKKLGKSRQWLYNVFESTQVSVDTIFAIGKAIHYDFSKDFKQLKNYSTKTNLSIAEDDNADYWKQKYISLLEEYNQLLKNKKKK
jgi:transcriptional regulator with XRE-family HTH domain